MLRISYSTIILVVAMAILLLAVTAVAEVPTTLNYQGVLADSLGVPIPDSTYSVIFTIYDAATLGSVVWTETQDVTTVNGQFAVLIGSINPITDTVFNAPVRFLGIQFGSNPESDPRIMMVTVPYAFRVATVDGASGGNITDKLSIGPGHTNTGLYAFVAGRSNIVSGDYASAGGGWGNTASGWGASMGGGSDNTASGDNAFVGGGEYNTASGEWAFVGGGEYNYANRASAFVGGGDYNYASGSNAFVGGGLSNTASGLRASVGGGSGNTASGSSASVSGGGGNTAADSMATVGGGLRNAALGKYSSILGGYADTITATGDYSYLFGLGSKLTQDSTFMVDMPHVRIGDEATGYELPASDGTVDQVMSTDGAGQLSWTTATGGGGGGWADDGNVVRLETSTDSVGIGTATPSEKLDVNGNIHVNGKATIGRFHTNTGNSAFVAGGSNTASGDYATVGGGYLNTASGFMATVGGGNRNIASGWSAIVGGGEDNIASHRAATVGGGKNNHAHGDYSVVAGGGGLNVFDSNSASGINSSILGGYRNTASGYLSAIGGGFFNTASGGSSTIGGGSSNTAIGAYATVGGGYSNVASGSHSFAVGQRAQALHDGSFVWADSYDGDFSSAASNQFNVRASGGTRIFSNSALSSGVTLVAGGSFWTGVCDSTLKRNIREVDYQSVLEKVAELPISQWSYKAQDESIEHMGPMAQDFYRLFGLDEDDKHINTLDPDGVALAAIKALNEQNQELKNDVENLKILVEKMVSESK